MNILAKTLIRRSGWEVQKPRAVVVGERGHVDENHRTKPPDSRMQPGRGFSHLCNRRYVATVD